MLGHFVPAGIDIGDETSGKYKRCTLLLKCFSGLGILNHMQNDGARKRYLKDHASFLRHQGFGVLCREQEILGFAFVDRDIDMLAQSPPVVALQFTDDEALRRALLALSVSKRELVQFILVDTPVFAYEPVLLGLQRITDLPLLDLLVNPAAITDSAFQAPKGLGPLISRLEVAAKTKNPDGVVTLVKKPTGRLVEVDDSQLNALLLALTSPVSLIQGPPGMCPAPLSIMMSLVTDVGVFNVNRDRKIIYWGSDCALFVRGRSSYPGLELHQPRTRSVLGRSPQGRDPGPRRRSNWLQGKMHATNRTPALI